MDSKAKLAIQSFLSERGYFTEQCIRELQKEFPNYIKSLEYELLCDRYSQEDFTPPTTEDEIMTEIENCFIKARELRKLIKYLKCGIRKYVKHAKLNETVLQEWSENFNDEMEIISLNLTFKMMDKLKKKRLKMLTA
jgi:hypothetical protein